MATATGKYASSLLWWYVNASGAPGLSAFAILPNTVASPSVKCARSRAIVALPVSSSGLRVEAASNAAGRGAISRRSQT